MDLIYRVPKTTYVYILYKDGTPVYVGEGKNGRCFDHPTKDHDEVRIVSEGHTKEEARELEDLIIKTYGYDNLLNKPMHVNSFFKKGNNHNTGRKHSPETKEKIRLSKIGKKRPDLAEYNRTKKSRGEKISFKDASERNCE